MIFISSYEDLDKDIVQHYLDKRTLIDRQTGKSICFIHFIDDVPILANKNTGRQDLIFHIYSEIGKNIQYKELGYSGLIAPYRACEEICSYFSIYKHQLPAILLIPKQNNAAIFTFPIKSIKNFDSLLLPIKLMNDFIDDTTIPQIKGKTSEDLFDILSDISSHIIFWENYNYETHLERYKKAHEEISCHLKKLGITITDNFSPNDLVKILKEHDIPNSFIREHNKPYSELKKNYKRISNGPINEEERLEKISYLKAKYNHYLELKKAAGWTFRVIKSL